MSKTPKALLSFSIIVDHESNPRGPRFLAVPVRSHIKLYRADDGMFEWRLGGYHADVVEIMPRNRSIEQAKLDAVHLYGHGLGPWYARASWM